MSQPPFGSGGQSNYPTFPERQPQYSRPAEPYASPVSGSIRNYPQQAYSYAPQPLPSAAQQPHLYAAQRSLAYAPLEGGADWTTALMLSAYLGWLGIDRFYVGKTGTGLIKLFTFGGFGVWYLVDIALILAGKFTSVTGQPLDTIGSVAGQGQATSGYSQQVFSQPQPYKFGQPGQLTHVAKDWTTTLVLSVFLGWLGVDRFYAGKVGTGLLKLLTFGGWGIWWLADVILIANGSFTVSNGSRLANRR